VSLNTDPERSKNIVVENFPKSIGITIIGRERVILASSESEAIKEFIDIFNAFAPSDLAERTWVWMFDAKRMQSDDSKDNELRLLQKCLQSLRGEVRVMVSEQTVIAVANADPESIKMSICGARMSAAEYGSNREGRHASTFFDNVDNCGRATNDKLEYETFTVFLPKSGKNERAKCFGHRMGDENGYPIGRDRDRRRIDQIRSSHLSDFHQVLPKKTHGHIDENKVQKLYRQGFLIFSYEKFLEI